MQALKGCPRPRHVSCCLQSSGHHKGADPHTPHCSPPSLGGFHYEKGFLPTSLKAISPLPGITWATRGTRCVCVGGLLKATTPCLPRSSLRLKLPPAACSTDSDRQHYLRSNKRQPSRGRHCCRWRACT